jgi:hypothetical protein
VPVISHARFTKPEAQIRHRPEPQIKRARVAADQFRRRYRELCDRGLTTQEIAFRCGYVTEHGHGNGRRLVDRLNATYVYEKTAERLAQGLDMDPVDVGL